MKTRRQHGNRILSLLLLATMIVCAGACSRIPADSTDDTKASQEETISSEKPRGSTQIIDSLFENETSQTVVEVADKEKTLYNTIDLQVPLPGSVLFSDRAKYEILMGDDDTVHTFAVCFWMARSYEEQKSILSYLYEGKTLEEWQKEKEEARAAASEYGYRLKNEGKTKEEVFADSEYIRLREIYYETEQTYIAGYSECRYQKYGEDYQSMLDFFRDLGFEEFHDIKDREWQITLSETSSEFQFAVSGTAANIKKLMEENTEYRISLAYVNDDGVILGNVSNTYGSNEEISFWNPNPYWAAKKLSERASSMQTWYGVAWRIW